MTPQQDRQLTVISFKSSIVCVYNRGNRYDYNIYTIYTHLYPRQWFYRHKHKHTGTHARLDSNGYSKHMLLDLQFYISCVQEALRLGGTSVSLVTHMPESEKPNSNNYTSHTRPH